MNARGQVTAGLYGSDLSATYGFDAYGYPTSTVTGTLQSYSYNFNTVTGNLNWRQNNKYTGLKETFNYDNSDRLDNVYQGTGTPVLTLDMAYDSNKGGITTKSDAGTMIYNYPGNPYALGAICPTTGLVPQNAQSDSCTSFECISTISENNYVASLTYNPEAQRAKMVVQQSGNTILTRWYSGSSYVKETAGGVTKQYTYIGGDAYTAPVVAIKTGTGTPVYYYLLRDYLGSITHVVNTSKTTVAEYSYDAWGRMRNPTNWTNYTPGTEPALFVAGRGFTGHEHMPWFNSINMNGRVYDPLIGQFLSPDNYVQTPDFTQNFNRYTYCLNNPLKYSDPSGMLAKEKDPQSDAWFDAYFGWLCNRDMNPISFGGGGGGYGLPGQGRNGNGLNGVYWDWTSFTYRSTSNFQEVNGPVFTRSDFEKTYNLQFTYAPKQSISGVSYYSSPTTPDGYAIRRFSPILFSKKDQNFAFRLLWDASCFGDSEFLENHAFLTSSGVLILPNDKNTADHCLFPYLPVVKIDNIFHVNYDNRTLEILGTFHTHPGGSEYDWINGDDFYLLSQYGPLFVLTDFWLRAAGYLPTGKPISYEVFRTRDFLNNHGIYGHVKLPFWCY